ncbi:metal-dependent transcriptional regulator [Halobacteriales archaeon QH_7_66_36]|nr:MAG: metal-dependent transcriptional regulator [Halobacteriales archaeon QH_7_66_36]
MNTQRQYLKAIYLIQESMDGPAATGDIADTVGVSPASANEMIGKLEERDLADHEKYKGVSLTDEGIARARDALETYCIIERFLVEVLEVDDEQFRAEARQLESVIDETVAERLDTIIDRSEQCPDCFAADDDVCSLLEAATTSEPAD